MIIETSDNRFYAVGETGDANLAHVWFGIRVKPTKMGYIPFKGAKTEMVRKAGCRYEADGVLAAPAFAAGLAPEGAGDGVLCLTHRAAHARHPATPPQLAEMLVLRALRHGSLTLP